MTQKISFFCDSCETRGLIKLGDDFDDAEVAYCPVCADPLDLDNSDDSDDV